MQNPFTTTFSKTPEYTYIHTEKTEEILENFIYDNPSESVYKITGVRGSGKTVILAKVEEELRTNESRYINWLVFDVNPARDILGQIAAMLVKAGFGSQDKKTTGIKPLCNSDGNRWWNRAIRQKTIIISLISV